jgi:hypothetical protein
MSKKDYIAFAAVLAGEFACATPSEKLVLWRTTLSLADVFKRDNIRFDRSRFYEAVFGDSDHFAVRDNFNRLASKHSIRVDRTSPHTCYPEGGING